MKFERRLLKENDSYRSLTEIRPRGVIIYSSGYPATIQFMHDTLNVSDFRASVHALIDSDGVTQCLPLDVKANHSGTAIGNRDFLSIMVCEPTHSNAVRLSELRDQTYNNLVNYLVFLCRYCHIDMNACDAIQFAGTANQRKLVTREVLKPAIRTKAFFGRIADDGSVGDNGYCNDLKLIREVRGTLRQISAKYNEVMESLPSHSTETAVDAIGIGDVVLFTGGDMFKSRGISTRLNFTYNMHYGVVTDYSARSKHVYEVAFLNGSTRWVNKSTLVRSTLGHVSL